MPMRRRLVARGLALWLAGMAGAGRIAAQATTEVNLANQAELEMVKGLGPQLSERVLAARHQAHFLSWDDFMARLPGIGPGRAAKLSGAGLRVAGQPYPTARDTPQAASAALRP